MSVVKYFGDLGGPAVSTVRARRVRLDPGIRGNLPPLMSQRLSTRLMGMSWVRFPIENKPF